MRDPAELGAGSPAGDPGWPASSTPSLEGIVDAMPQLVWMADAEGVVTFYNDRASRYSGISRRPDRSWSWAPVVHPDDAERTSTAWATAAASRTPYECEHRLLMADGSYRWHISRATAVPTGATGEITWFGTATDIDDRRALEDALRASEARYRATFESAAVGVARVAPDGSWLEVNAALCEIVGRSRAELLSTSFQAITHPDDLEADLASLHELLDGRRTRYSMEKRYLTPSGTVVWVDLSVALIRTADGAPDHLVSVVKDVTARIEAEVEARRASAALEESEARFRKTADHAPVMMWVTEADGTCSYLNETWYRFTGQTPATGLGFGWLDATHPDDRAEAAATFAAANEAHEPFRIEYRLRRHDGAYRWAIDAAAPRLGPDGAFLGYIGSVIDITERKEAEEALTARHAAEHQVAVRLQEALLPRVPARRDDVELATRYAPATDALDVGGDWYESFTLTDGRLGIVVGDVVGHNVEAAAAMGQLRAGILALATRTDEPDELLVALDEFTVRNAITDFATATCATLDPVTGVLHHASAGHPPLLVVDPDGSHRWLDDATSPPLAAMRTTARARATTTLAPGSLLLAYSDGLVERRGRPVDVGLAQLARVAVSVRHAPIEHIADEVVRAMGEGVAFHDDVVVLCLRLPEPDATRFRRVVASDTAALGGLRADLRGWLVEREVPDDRAGDVLLAVGEACNNAVLHAYGEGEVGPVSVAVTDLGTGEVEVRVADTGSWRTAVPDGLGGRGVGIMELLATSFSSRTGPGGTTIEMRLPLR